MRFALIGFFGLAALGCSTLVIVLRQPMRCALALVAHMICLAALFACINVQVVALFQVLIYVGAVMVLMIYTIMLLDDQDSSIVHRFSRWSLPAVAVAAVVIASLGALLGAMVPMGPPMTQSASAPFDFAAFSVAFMTRYWFHFELATALLAICIVASWIVISQLRREGP
jgi:NADH-quinone oxidoreductase subunit J